MEPNLPIKTHSSLYFLQHSAHQPAPCLAERFDTQEPGRAGW